MSVVGKSKLGGCQEESNKMLEFESHASLHDACDSLLFHILWYISRTSICNLYSSSVCTLPRSYFNNKSPVFFISHIACSFSPAFPLLPCTPGDDNEDGDDGDYEGEDGKLLLSLVRHSHTFLKCYLTQIIN